MIGAGRIGRVHLETLAGVPGVQPVILSDVVEPVLKEVRAQCFGVVGKGFVKGTPLCVFGSERGGG